MLLFARSVVFAGIVFLAALPATPSGLAQTSRNATLLSNMNLHSRYSGVWSYIHHDGREYAAIGTETGTSIVRLTIPSAPVEVAFITGVTAGTRDIRQYRNYLYVVANFTRGATAGIQIIDMSDPDLPALVSTYTATVQTAEYVNVDTTRALLFANEANGATEIGGTHILSLADPVNPVEVGTYTPPYRIHDFHPHGNVGYGCAIDNQSVDIVDISNPATPTRIASFPTPFQYPHSSWATADGAYLLVTQEWFFQSDFGRPSVFDVRDPSNVTLTYSFNDLPDAVSHIPVIHGNIAAVSYYTAGVRLFDLSVPSRPVEFGFYDTWPGDDFLLAGCYQAAALFPSGIVCAADDLTGLYVIQPVLTYGIVRGVVRDAGGGMKPLGGVTVRALPDGPSTTTAADGSYALAPSPGSSVSIQAAKYGYASQTATVSIASGSDQTQDFSLSPLPTGSVKGTVRSFSTGAALAGADVSILDAPFAAVTGARGTYSFSKVATGAAIVRAEYPGLIPIATPVTVAGGKAAIVNFSLTPAPFYDDAELDQGWALSDPTDDATQGRWVRGAPIGTFNGSDPAEPSQDHSPSGTFCFVTGNNSSVASLSCVAGGKTTLTSPALDLSSVPDPRIVYWRWYYHNATVGAAAGASQPFITEISNDGGTSWTTVSQLQRERAPWERVEIRVTDFFAAPGLVRVRFTAQNRISGALVEAAIDDFEYYAGGSMTSARRDSEHGGLAAAAIGMRMRGATPRESGIEFRLELDHPEIVDAIIVDVRGRRVATVHHGPLSAGPQRLLWNGRSDQGSRIGSGIYFLRAVANGSEARHKFVLLR